MCSDTSLNEIGNKNTSLSLSWFARKRRSYEMIKLQNNIYNFLEATQRQIVKNYYGQLLKNIEVQLSVKVLQRVLLQSIPEPLTNIAIKEQ